MRLITDEKDCLRVHLGFLRNVTRTPITVESIRDAIEETAPLLHVQKILVTITGGGTGISRMNREVFYENTRERAIEDAMLSLDFEIDRGLLIRVEIFPYGCEFTSMDKDALEIYVMETCFCYERMSMNNIIEEISMRQYLTRLPNANGYLKMTGRILRDSDIEIYSSFYFNLKAFGNINRLYGQEMGDEIIRRYSRILRSFTDEDECLGHLGGDNFTALIKTSRRNDFIDFLAKIKMTVDVDGEEKIVRIPATSGVWDIHERVSEPGEIISRASIAYNYAKNVTHRPNETLTPAIMEHVMRQRDVLGQYRQSLADGEFIPYYQPKVDSRTGVLTGAEALVRWVSMGNVITPGYFIPTLERNGRMSEIDYHMIKCVCADLKSWIEKGIEVVPVSINVSRDDLDDEDFAKKIDGIIESCGLEKSLIEIEMTETSDFKEQKRLSAFIDELNSRGISTAIDDFGTGYSSLGTLREFRARTLKIDRTFVMGDLLSGKDAIILKDIIHMAGQLGMNVIMEGVERQDQLEFVTESGCYIIQGYYYDKPLSKRDFQERLISRVY